MANCARIKVILDTIASNERTGQPTAAIKLQLQQERDDLRRNVNEFCKSFIIKR